MAYEVRDFQDIYSMVMEELKIQSTDTTSVNRIKRDVNAVYLHEVAPFKRWYWLSGNTQVEHKPYYASGTASVTPDSTTVTLSVAPSTSKKGYYFSTDAFSEIYKISAHTAGSTTVTLSSPFTGNVNSAAAYKIWTDELILPTDCRETVEVWHDFTRIPMKPVGLQEFRRIVNERPRMEGRPSYYTTYDFVDPSSGDGEEEADRYRVMKIYPSLLDKSTTINVDYTTDIEPLDVDGDEPLMPIHDRIVLVYGALHRAWSRERNPEEAARNLQLFNNKLAQMAGHVEDSHDRPQLIPDSIYLSRKRGPRLSRFRGVGSLEGGSYSAPSYLKGVTIEGATITDNVTVSAGVTIDGRDISVDGLALDTLSATIGNIETADRAVITDGSGNLEESDITSNELTYLDDVEPLSSDATLADNTSSATVLTSWAVASFDTVFLKYSIERGSNKESGMILLTSDGTNVGSAELAGNVGTLGVTFTFDVSSGSLRWLYTTTSTGTAATLKYKAEKWLG